MKILFVHQNMPGQFRHLASALGHMGEHEVAFITRRKDLVIPGVLRVSYELKLPKSCNRRFGDDFELRVLHGEAVFRSCQALAQRGFTPDIIFGHPGWGELLFVKDCFPAAKLINYCEFYHNPSLPYFEGDPPRPLSLAERIERRAQSAHLLLSLDAADYGWSPTLWQKSTHPSAYHNKIQVVFDGVDTEIVRPAPKVRFQTPKGPLLGPEDEVITYVARSLEPCRGFPNFFRALPDILARRPKAHVVIVGSEAPHYDKPPAKGVSWLAHMREGIEVDENRVHFTGALPWRELVKVYQISKAHVYLTAPIVLSWSFAEAMAAGCLIIGSSTPPVLEFMQDGQTGFITDFNSPVAIADDIERALSHPDKIGIRNRARLHAIRELDLTTCLKKQLEMLNFARN